MARILFQRAASGFRTVRGSLVKDVQRKLRENACDPGDLDGVYGDQTERALVQYQQKNGLSPHGKVDEDLWKKLVASTIPGILDRCLQLTADFEGHGFTKIQGNFDGAGLTWGIIGFTWKNREIQKILEEVNTQHPQLLDKAFGRLKSTLLEKLTLSLDEQMQWAQELSFGRQGVKVQLEWSEAFSTLGDFSEVQAIQLERVRKYWDRARNDVQQFGLQSELGMSLCFDIAVQNGGIDAEESGRIRKKLQATPPTSEQDRRIVIANIVADNSNPRWMEDVRQRKLTIATGRGSVHGAQYEVKTWGVDELPAF